MELIPSQMEPLGSLRIFTIDVNWVQFSSVSPSPLPLFGGTVLIPSNTGEWTASLGHCAGLKKVTGCLPRKRQENLRIKGSKTINCIDLHCYLLHLVWDRAHSRKQRLCREHAVIRIAWIAWGNSNCSVSCLLFHYTLQLNKLYKYIYIYVYSKKR